MAGRIKSFNTVNHDVDFQSVLNSGRMNIEKSDLIAPRSINMVKPLSTRNGQVSVADQRSRSGLQNQTAAIDMVAAIQQKTKMNTIDQYFKENPEPRKYPCGPGAYVDRESVVSVNSGGRGIKDFAASQLKLLKEP